MRWKVQCHLIGGNMLKARRIGRWLAIVGVALAAQGCWEEQENLTLIGEGGCRTADGGHGDSWTVQVAAAEDCEAHCSAEEVPCTAVEYNANNGMCEIHREPIARFEHVAGVACYAMR
jgi:PAN domain